VILLAVKATIAAYAIATHLLNAAYDTPHVPESRPNYAETCWDAAQTAVWVEIATPTSYVCDYTGQILWLNIVRSERLND
jgi:hypothetical protein